MPKRESKRLKSNYLELSSCKDCLQVQMIYGTANPNSVTNNVEWTMFPPHTYRVMAWFTPADEGGFTVESINLPGCITEGDTWDEAIAMLRDAAAGLIRAYRDRGELVPWVQSGPMPNRPSQDSKRVTVFVTVKPT